MATFPSHKTSCTLTKAMNGDGRHPGYHILNKTNPLLHSIVNNLKMSNFCVQHDTVAELKHCHTVTCMRVNGHTWTSSQGQTWCNKGHINPHRHPQHPHYHCPPVQVQPIHVQVHVPMEHMEGTVLVFESKTAANARVHARTHATQYRTPSIWVGRD